MNWYRTKLSLTLLLTMVMTFGTVSFFNHVNAEVTQSDLDYAVITAPANLQLAISEKRMVEITFQNVSGVAWDATKLELATTYSNGQLGRSSIWNGAGWTNSMIIKPVTSDAVLPGRNVQFSFELAAPAYAGLFKEHLAFTLDKVPMKGGPVVVTIQVGDTVSLQSTDAKEIHIYRATQLSNLVENGYIVATLPISSGKVGYITPAATYTILNQHEEAYSAKYKLYMSNWQGLTREGKGYEGYGLHSLAYWKTSKPLYPSGTIKNGRLYVGNRVYEDAIHLGKPMSHGCIRYSVEASAFIFDWADVGTKVRVV